MNIKELTDEIIRLKTELIRITELENDIIWPNPLPQKAKAATPHQLDQVEKKFELSLPPSYRSFLSYTNGLRSDDDWIPVLCSTQELIGPAYRNHLETYSNRYASL
jgi:hypothetical protein